MALYRIIKLFLWIIVISIAETFVVVPSLFKISSVLISIDSISISVMNLFLTISATSTALLIALPCL